MRGRIGFEACDYPQGRLLLEAWDVARAVSTKEVIVVEGFQGIEIREELTRRRIPGRRPLERKALPQPQD